MQSEELFLKKLKISVEENKIIAVTGGGGKTSLIFRLKEELVHLGKKVIITTSTHMYYEKNIPFAENGDPQKIQQYLNETGYVIAAQRELETGKIRALPLEKLEKLKDYDATILIEADGSKGRPLKMPEEWEPVIPDMSDTVIGVVGLDALEKPIGEVTHRTKKICQFLDKTETMPVTDQDIISIIFSQKGLLKGVNNRDFRVYLNKADILNNSRQVRLAENILSELKKKKIYAVIGNLKQDETE